jgi:SAM-dependent methyltransferase
MTSPDLSHLPFSPAAERNAPFILSHLKLWLPKGARVLELASGTGQHAAHFAAARPDWHWQPSELAADALATIAARCQGVANVAPPLQLDVMEQPWPVPEAAFDAVYSANLVHIAPWPVTTAMMLGAARGLGAKGQLLTYGPFKVPGQPLAPSNAAFDADLRQRNPDWGLRELTDVQAAAEAAGLHLAEGVALPANNLLLRWVRATAP